MNKAYLRALTAAIGAAAALATVNLTSGSEGLSTHPYHDTVGSPKMTVCYGETNVAMRNYTADECKAMLANSLASYTRSIKTNIPGFDNLTPGQKSAIVDFSYNRGLGAVERPSRAGEPPSVLDAYQNSDFPAACDLYTRWAVVERRGRWVDCSVRSNGCYGIYTRRQAERAECLKG
ncbi:glycoside hydrolase family protein [Paraburkholderia sediminicola]|uniref:glycoside hydrolase family protein n=1 Tax=Paraburkholderia sediminicola TaxID=458836 RepID=UPI0038B7EBF0